MPLDPLDIEATKPADLHICPGCYGTGSVDIGDDCGHLFSWDRKCPQCGGSGEL